MDYAFFVLRYMMGNAVHIERLPYAVYQRQASHLPERGVSSFDQVRDRASIAPWRVADTPDVSWRTPPVTAHSHSWTGTMHSPLLG